MIRMLISIPIIAAILVFAFVNNELVTFNLWPFEIEITSSLSVVIIGLILLGFVLGRISAWFAYLPLRATLVVHKMQNRKLSKEQQKASDEVAGLKDSIDSLKKKDIEKPKSGEEAEIAGLKNTLVKLFRSPENKN